MSISRTRIQPINYLQKSIENIISITGSVSGSSTLNNGQYAIFTITTTGTSGNRTFVVHDWTLYIGSVAAANALPDGASITPTQWSVQTFVNDFGSTDNVDTVTKIYVQNVSAGASQKVIIDVQARMIQNSTTLGGSAT